MLSACLYHSRFKLRVSFKKTSLSITSFPSTREVRYVSTKWGWFHCERPCLLESEIVGECAAGSRSGLVPHGPFPRSLTLRQPRKWIRFQAALHITAGRKYNERNSSPQGPHRAGHPRHAGTGAMRLQAANLRSHAPPSKPLGQVLGRAQRDRDHSLGRILFRVGSWLAAVRLARRASTRAEKE